MATDSKSNKRLQRNYFLLIILFVWAVVVAFTLFVYGRERQFKVELLDASLQQVNLVVADGLKEGQPVAQLFANERLLHPELRLTLLDLEGNVQYDSSSPEGEIRFSNHLKRTEIASALETGRGREVRRLSESTRRDYFYSALKADSLLIRTSLPYTTRLDHNLSVGHSFMWFIIAVTLLISWLGKVALKRMHRADEAVNRERQHALYEERQKIRIKKQLTSSINHELKTPVSAINGCLETLMNNPQMDAQQQRAFVEKSYAQTQRLSHLLQDVSTITRMDEAPELIQKERLSLRTIIEEVVEDVTACKENLPMRIHCENFAMHTFDMEGNDALLHSIFRNLIDNAMAYSGGRDIYIRFLFEEFDEEDRFYHFSFADNGIGVDEEHLPHLFERFYRVDKGRSRKLGGTGLGLSIVKNAVLMHGGTIEVCNRPEGGLEYTFSLKAN